MSEPIILLVRGFASPGLPRPAGVEGGDIARNRKDQMVELVPAMDEAAADGPAQRMADADDAPRQSFEISRDEGNAMQPAANMAPGEDTQARQEWRSRTGAQEHSKISQPTT